MNAERRLELRNAVRRFLGRGQLVAADAAQAALPPEIAPVVAAFHHVLQVLSAAGTVRASRDLRGDVGGFALTISPDGPLDVHPAPRCSVVATVTIVESGGADAGVRAARKTRARVRLLREFPEAQYATLAAEWWATGVFIDGHLAWAASRELVTPWTMHHAPGACPSDLHDVFRDRPIVTVELGVD